MMHSMTYVCIFRHRLLAWGLPAEDCVLPPARAALEPWPEWCKLGRTCMRKHTCILLSACLACNALPYPIHSLAGLGLPSLARSGAWRIGQYLWMRCVSYDVYIYIYIYTCVRPASMCHDVAPGNSNFMWETQQYSLTYGCRMGKTTTNKYTLCRYIYV